MTPNPSWRRAINGLSDVRIVDWRLLGCARWSWVAAFAFGFALPTPVNAQDAPPSVTVAVRDTADFWTVTSGSDPGSVALNKLQLSATLNGDRSGLTGWSLHGQVFRADGGSLSARLGDIQTADNIETPPVTRLFEAWLQKTFGTGDRTLALRAGLLDYNADFDSLDTASLFLNSSHGIGADVARSGLNGPSIFPVSALGMRAAFSPSATWTFRLAVFDGVPGDLENPRRFATVRLRPGDGALIATQIDFHLSDKARVALGAWQYSRPLPQIAQPTTSALDHGIYAAIEGPWPGQDRISGWLRFGYAAGKVQPVKSYVGAGVVLKAPLPGRPDDRLGLAVARASVSADNAGLPLAGTETSVEATYQFKVSDGLALQPESQYIICPSGHSDARDGFAFGLRLIFTAGYPRKAPATQASDPTVPPDGPQAPDQSSDKPS